MDNVPKIPHGRITQIMQHGQIPAAVDIAVECLQLALGCVGVRPPPVFDVDAPVDDLGVFDALGEDLARAGPDSTVWGTEVAGYLLISLLVLGKYGRLGSMGVDGVVLPDYGWMGISACILTLYPKQILKCSDIAENIVIYSLRRLHSFHPTFVTH